MVDFPEFLIKPLKVTDSELHDLIVQERHRQKTGLELIASENFTSASVLECLGSCLTNKYSEGLPGKRYYGGNEFIDKIETLCCKRALKAFRLDEKLWGVNVQPYSGSPANFAAYTALLNPHDRIMGLHLADGGHLTHGFMSKTRKVSATSLYWESMSYRVNPKTGLIDYDELKSLATKFLPRLIIAGFSCYPRHLDFRRFREIADSVGALLLADISHVAGLVAAGLSPAPFEFAHVVTTTTHKIIRGPRAGIIFFRKDSGPNYSDLETKINSAVFPGLQGGPHNNSIAALATALKQVDTDEFRQYAQRVIENCQTMQKRLLELGYNLITGGSDNHLILVSFKGKGVNGSIIERALEMVNITVNKNACPGDTNMLNPSGIRIGTPALTTRGFTSEHMVTVVDMMHECLLYAQSLISGRDKTSLSEFDKICQDPSVKHNFEAMRQKVEKFSEQFPYPE